MAAQDIKPNLDPQPRVNTMPHLAAVPAVIDPNTRINTKQLAALLCVSPVSLINARSEKRSPIAYSKMGKMVHYRYGDAMAYLDSLPKFKQ